MTGEQPQPLNLAVIGNCEVSALIDARGRLVWMCLPRPDGDPVFSALLTPALGGTPRGTFAVDLTDLAQAEQRYERNTAIVETTLRDAHGGAIRIVDFCPRFRTRGRMFRPMMLIRILQPVAGRPVDLLGLRPRGRRRAGAHPGPPRSHHLRFQAGRLEDS